MTTSLLKEKGLVIILYEENLMATSAFRLNKGKAVGAESPEAYKFSPAFKL